MWVVVRDLVSSECPQVVDNLRRACTVVAAKLSTPGLLAEQLEFQPRRGLSTSITCALIIKE